MTRANWHLGNARSSSRKGTSLNTRHRMELGGPQTPPPWVDPPPCTLLPLHPSSGAQPLFPRTSLLMGTGARYQCGWGRHWPAGRGPLPHPHPGTQPGGCILGWARGGPVLGTGLSCLPDPDLPASPAVFPTPADRPFPLSHFVYQKLSSSSSGRAAPGGGHLSHPPTPLLPVQYSPRSPRPGQSTPLPSRHLCHCLVRGVEDECHVGVPARPPTRQLTPLLKVPGSPGLFWTIIC